MTHLLDAALAYAAGGWPVFPLLPGDKKPLKGSGGFKDATTDPDQIRAWWERNPRYNIGIPTGAASGFVVIDTDNPDAEEYITLQSDTETRRATTPRGRHRLYQHPGYEVRNTTALHGVAGVDIRGDGGYIVAAPSKRADGCYAWENDSDLAPLPAWVTRKPEQARPSGNGFQTDDRYAQTALNNELAELARCQNGTRNDMLFKVARRVNEFVQAGRLPESVFQEIETVAQRTGLSEREIATTLQSARNGGTPEDAGRPTQHRRNGTAPEQAQAAPDVPSRPAPLPLQDHDITPFPADALPEWLHRYTHGVAVELEVDPGAVALLSLSVLSTIYQRRYRVGITRGLAPHTEPLALWTLFTAHPGERKSAVLKALTWPMLAFQKRYNLEMAERYEQHWQGHNEKENGPIPDPPQPLALALTDITQEALVTTLQEQHERAGIFSSEGNSLLSVHVSGVYRGGAADVSLLNAAWSGDTVDVSRKRDRQRSTLYEPLVSMGVCIQPGVLSGASANRIARASGFLARWLYCCPDSKLGSREHNPPELDTGPRLMYEGTITRELETAFPFDYPAPEPATHTLSLDSEGFAAYRDYQRTVEPRLGNTNALSVYRDWYAKAPGQAVRIAALLCLIEGQKIVTAAHMRRGVAVVEWSANHMRRAYGISSGADVSLAQRALAWIQRKQPHTLTARALQRGISIAADEAQDVVDTLIDHGYLQELESKRRTTEYEVHPALLSESVRTVGESVRAENSPSGSGGASYVSESVRTSVREGLQHTNGVKEQVSESMQQFHTKTGMNTQTPHTQQKNRDSSDTSGNSAPECAKGALTHPLTPSDSSYTEPHPNAQNGTSDSSGGSLTLSSAGSVDSSGECLQKERVYTSTPSGKQHTNAQKAASTPAGTTSTLSTPAANGYTAIDGYDAPPGWASEPVIMGNDQEGWCVVEMIDGEAYHVLPDEPVFPTEEAARAAWAAARQ